MFRRSNILLTHLGHRTQLVMVLLLSLLVLIMAPILVHASSLLEITELLTHPEQYDHQEAVAERDVDEFGEHAGGGSGFGVQGSANQRGVRNAECGAKPELA